VHLAYIWIVSHLSAKNYRNLWKFEEVLTKTNLLSFFGTRCRFIFRYIICYALLMFGCFVRKPVKAADFHSYVRNLERDSGLLFTVEYEVGLIHIT